VRRYLGLDGEGTTDPETGRHSYVLLAAANKRGENRYIEDYGGLRSSDCLDFLLELPDGEYRSYAFTYDVTKILQDLPPRERYLLARPDELPEERREVEWRDYVLSLHGTRFEIRRLDKTFLVWDIWKFFNSNFVTALTRVGIGTEEERARIKAMKEKRSDFANLSHDQIRAYCLDECRLMAQLGRSLDEMHEQAGLRLTVRFGAGSTSAKILHLMKVRTKYGEVPDDMRISVACAFFGGRPEASQGGMIEPCETHDVSSCYPYVMFSHPCLRHSAWIWTRREKDLEHCLTALVHYGLDAGRDEVWGPLPFRRADNTVVYPRESSGGWAWLSEYQAAREGWDGAYFRGAWILAGDCGHRPFARIIDWYRLRYELGKEGPGYFVKNGINGGYGKTAQSKGKAPFNNWIYAGLTTAGGRAILLRAIAAHKDRAKVKIVATDSITTTERGVRLPPAIPTGTHDLDKPLGGWETKEHRAGLFVFRPGILKSLGGEGEKEGEARARGIGRRELDEQWRRMVDEYQYGRLDLNYRYHVGGVSRFCGIKSSTRMMRGVAVASADYGNWRTVPIKLSFYPLPKRAGWVEDGYGMALWHLPPEERTQPYGKALGMMVAGDPDEDLDEWLAEQPDYV
jgi:hypothetical protein